MGTGLYSCENDNNNSGCLWSSNQDTVYLMGSNVAIGKSNAEFPLDVVGSIYASQNIYALMGCFKDVITTNEIVTNLTGRNALIDNLMTNRLQTDSITLNKQTNQQVIDKFQKTSSLSPSSLSISWGNVNSSFSNMVLCVEVQTQLSAMGSSTTRTERFDIDTLIPVNITSSHPVGTGNFSLMTSITNTFASTNNGVTFTSQSLTSDITSFNVRLKILSFPDQNIVGHVTIG
jgi:hypothetical protein